MMALGIGNGGGGSDRIPHVKYNAKAGRIYRVDRAQAGNGDWVTEEVEITDGFQAAFDLANIQVGWAAFPPGAAPSFSWVRLGEKLPDRPSADHKQGFRLTMKLGKSVGGDLREMTATAGNVIASFDALHDAYTAGLKDSPGKVPVVALKGVKPVTNKHGTNFEPAWEIVSWIDRPVELSGDTSTPVATSTQAPAPVTQPRSTSQVIPATAPMVAGIEF